MVRMSLTNTSHSVHFLSQLGVAHSGTRGKAKLETSKTLLSLQQRKP